MSDTIKSLNSTKRKFLFICAHPDDDVLVGGTIRKLVDHDWQVDEVILTKGENGSRKNGEGNKLGDVRIQEAIEYCRLLGMNEPVFLDGKDGFLHDNQEIVTRLVGILRKIRPDVMVLLSGSDYHHDHRQSHNIGLHAIELAFRKWAPELGERLTDGIILESDGLNVLANPLVNFNTSDTHSFKKEALEEAYHHRLSRSLMDFTEHLAAMRGARIKCKYAESYCLVNPAWYKLSAKSVKILQEFVEIGDVLQPK